MVNEIKKALDKVRPAMQADGGDVEFVNFDNKTGRLEVRLKGMCAGCPMAQITLNEGIKKAVQKAVPEVKEVISV
ncbi:NifU family protein [Candidatus Parcubacteria bacterium]|nr:NifU family protein [Candidatus Parcubacteria bacterium]